MRNKGGTLQFTLTEVHMAQGNQVIVVNRGDEIEVTVMSKDRTKVKYHGSARVKKNDPDKLASEIARLRGEVNRWQ